MLQKESATRFKLSGTLTAECTVPPPSSSVAPITDDATVKVMSCLYSNFGEYQIV